MGWLLTISKAAQRDLVGVPKAVRTRVIAAINGLRENIHPPGSAKLQGHAALFRIRVGD